MNDRFERIMWFGLFKAMLSLNCGSVLSIIFKDFIFLIVGSGLALIIWIIYSIYHVRYMKNLEVR